MREDVNLYRFRLKAREGPAASGGTVSYLAGIVCFLFCVFFPFVNSLHVLIQEVPKRPQSEETIRLCLPHARTHLKETWPSLSRCRLSRTVG